MKINEVPEKIWLGKYTQNLMLFDPNSNTYVEYTRTDVFIEKAENYLRNKCQRFILTEKDIEDFKRYLKGE